MAACFARLGALAHGPGNLGAGNLGAGSLGAGILAAGAVIVSALLLAATNVPVDTQAATITIVNVDGNNEGFNDPTPATPIGGNSGTTRGQQRLIAFQFAADVWGALLPSDVEIYVTASFDPMTCTSTSAVLGAAGAWQIFSDFPNAPLPATWYVSALTNKLVGYDYATGGHNTDADDIQARFNVSVDNATCLGTRSWYYGLDGNHGTDLDLLVVLLHEFGHGLGFASTANSSSGNLLGGVPDIYTRFLYDNTVGRHWTELTALQRVDSAVNSRNVALDAPFTTTVAAGWMGYLPELLVTAPAGVAGSYYAADAAFGPSVSTRSVSGQVVQAVDTTAPTGDACEPLTNAAALSGKIALIDRGDVCTFVDKVQAAQNAGATGVIVVNNVAGTPTTMGGSSSTITIPSVIVSQDDGAILKAQLTSGLFATLRQSAVNRAGLDPAGRVLVYTPSPLQPGSSVSHFDVSASPNLLMEPAINGDLSHDSVDLTLGLFHDEGWFADAAAPVPYGGVRSLLRQNAPNPFNPSTTISFALAAPGDTELQVFDVRGANVRRLVAGELPAGEHSVTWDGRDDDGVRVPSGVYFYKLRSGAFEGLQRMVLLK
jgi:hypothetical protein